MPTPPSSEANAVWTLCGETSRRVECWITQEDACHCNLTITYGAEILFDEPYADRATADMHAATLKDRLVAHGWTPVSGGT